MAWERYSGDDLWWGMVEGVGIDWVRRADNPDEDRYRILLDWDRLPLLTGLRPQILLGFEYVTRFDFTEANRSNFFVQVKVGSFW